MTTPSNRRALARTEFLVALLAGVLACSTLFGAALFLLADGLAQDDLREGEARAIELLNEIVVAQEHFRAERLMDADGDGKGEYGYLQELTAASWRSASRRPPRPIRFLPEDVGRRAAAGGGVSSWGGYHVLVYLPGPTTALPETHPLTLPAQPGSAADRQEEHWVAYAWPRDLGRTGRRTFVVNETGGVLAAVDPDRPYHGRRDRIPEAAAAYDSSGPDPANLGSGLSWFTGGAAVDGNAWQPVEDGE